MSDELLGIIITGIFAIVLAVARTSNDAIISKKERNRNSDKRTYEEFIELLPPDGAIMQLRITDFGGTFNRVALSPLQDFTERCKQPDFIFLDKGIEARKQAIYKNIEEVYGFIAFSTFPSPTDPEVYASINKDRRHEDPENLAKELEHVHLSVDTAWENYEKLIDIARKELL